MKKLISGIVFFLFAVGSLAQTFNFLDINNVKARINPNGDLFWDDSLTNSYEVPRGSGKQSIYAGALWIGGFENNHSLRLSAQTYRQTRNDFRPGPWSADSLSSVFWNRVWKVSRLEIDSFVYEFTHGFPDSNYVVPEVIQSWPGNGDTTMNQDHILSPFIDVNNDGNYNYLDGDYPCIKGDQTVYFIFNDGVNPGQSQQNPVNIEIHAMVYAFQSPDPAMNNSIFLNYKIINRNTTTNIDSTFIGNWTDFDLGRYDDDYIGCDVKRNMYYAYNGDDNDEGANGYGFNPPAQGVVFLKGPEADMGDGVDNDRDSCVDCTLYHTPSGDSIVADNISPEKIAMSDFMYYNNNNDPVSGNPSDPFDFYGYMKSFWRNNTHMTYGGNGNGGGIGTTLDPAYFMFPGNSDPHHWGTNGIAEADWDELIAGNLPDDRRGVASMGGFTLYPGEVVCIDYAYVFARADTGGRLASVDSLKCAVDRVRAFYNSHPELKSCECTPPSLTGVSSIDANYFSTILFPNPTSVSCTLQLILRDKSNPIIEIVDEMGRVIRSFYPKLIDGLNQIELDLKNIEAGIYIVRIRGKEFSAVKKLILK